MICEKYGHHNIYITIRAVETLIKCVIIGFTGRVFKPHIQIAHQTHYMLKNIFSNPRTRMSNVEETHIIYEIRYNDYDKVDRIHK